MIKTRNIKTFIASTFGTILEGYDFILFAYLSPILAKLFFPSSQAINSLLMTYAIFAVGFLARPLGGILFGHLGDKYGRKQTLVLTVLFMSLPTFFIGLMPTYSVIGIWAPIVLVFLRILQGISAGGEATGAILFVLESSSTKYRGFLGGLVWGSTGLGMLMGSIAALWVAHSHLIWAWRIPFLLGIVSGIVGFYLRHYTQESLLYKKSHLEKEIVTFPLRASWNQSRNKIYVGCGVYILSAMISYLIFVFMPSYLHTIVKISFTTSTVITTVAFLAVSLLVPVGGYLSDLTSRRTLLLIGAVGFLFLSYPLFWLISTGGSDHLIFAECVFVILAICYQGALPSFAFELFPTNIRFSSIALTYNLSYSLFGGTAPFIATALVRYTHHAASPGIYLSLGALIALSVLLGLNRTARV